MIAGTVMAGLVHVEDVKGAVNGFEAARFSGGMPQTATVPFFDEVWTERA
jgi:hypothetical protein